MADTPELTDEMIAGRRADVSVGLPDDMPPWMHRTIVVIDTFSQWIGHLVSWLTVPLMFAMVYEVIARYAFTAPTVWAYDISRMIYGAMFVLGAAYALSKGVHIRSDFLYRKWSVKTQGRVDTALYVIFYFPAHAHLPLGRLQVGLDLASSAASAAWTPRGCRCWGPCGPACPSASPSSSSRASRSC